MFSFRPPNTAETYMHIMLFHPDTDTTHKHPPTYKKKKKNSLALPLHPPTSAWHTSKAPPGRLEERGACEHGSLPSAFCLHSMEVLYCQGSVTSRPKPEPVSLYSRKSKNASAAHTLDSHFSGNLNLVLQSFLRDTTLLWFSNTLEEWKAVLIHHEMGFILVNPKATSIVLWLGYGNIKKCLCVLVMLVSGVGKPFFSWTIKTSRVLFCYSTEV